SGRQESNLPEAAYQTAASPLGPRPECQRPVGESNPSVSARQAGRVTRCVTARIQQGRKESNPLHAGWSRIAHPGARPYQSSCPGRTRTYNPLLNREPHHRCATEQSSVRMVGFEPTLSSTPSWRISRLSYILIWVAVQVARAVFHTSESWGAEVEGN